MYDEKLNKFFYNAKELNAKENKVFHLIKKGNLISIQEKMIINSLLKFILTENNDIEFENLIKKLRAFLSNKNVIRFNFDKYYSLERIALLLSPEILKKHILENSEIFIIENNKVSVVDDKKFFNYYFNNLLIDIKTFDNILHYLTVDLGKEENLSQMQEAIFLPYRLGWQVIVSVKFVGDDFPLEESKEYINLRKIIYINPEPDIFIQNIQRPFQWFLPEFYENLNALIPDEKEFKKFIEENLAFSVIILPTKMYNSTFDFLIKEFSPILNLKDNPGNLFYYTISKKVEELKRKKEQSTD